MSYDIRIGYEVVGMDEDFVVVITPEYDNPTYNLREMFVASMGWHYLQGKSYPLQFAFVKFCNGYKELLFNRQEYVKYNSPNGFGTIDDAIECIGDIIKTIIDNATTYDIKELKFRW